MPAIRSLALRFWPELLWAAFAAANAAVMFALHEWQTVPFHLIWVSVTVLYGFRVWRPGATATVLVLVCVVTGLALLRPIQAAGGEGVDELSEVPLMAAMFVAMVWHARRREAAMGEVRAAIERQREFVRDASHLLRTPITVARGHAELAAAGCDPTTREDLGVVIDELHRLSRLSDRLLVLAAAEDERFTSVRPVSISGLLAGIVRRWSVAVDRDWSCDAPSEGTFDADEERLVCALDAVVENAVKATGTHDRVLVRGRFEGPTVVLEVCDTGRGIAAEELGRVFDRFARVPHPDGGTGLGLPIVKAIVEAHGGTVDVASERGSGTTVSLRLPAIATMPSQA